MSLVEFAGYKTFENVNENHGNFYSIPARTDVSVGRALNYGANIWVLVIDFFGDSICLHVRLVVQRVLSAAVQIEDKIHSEIGEGLCVFLGVGVGDNASDIQWLVKKLTGLRIFGDQNGKMNFSVLDLNRQILVISQFTLHASTEKGNRPSFIKSADPESAIKMYHSFISELKGMDIGVCSGVFGADMKVHIINDGPVTILLDSKNRE